MSLEADRVCEHEKLMVKSVIPSEQTV
jgi:hypothetical protein